MKKKKPLKLNKPHDCHGCIYYNVYSDYCTRKGLICKFLALQDVYAKKQK